MCVVVGGGDGDEEEEEGLNENEGALFKPQKLAGLICS